MKKLFDLIRRSRKRDQATGKVPAPIPSTISLAKQRTNFASRLALMKAEAGALGLFLTMQRLDPAVRMVGFEIAGNPDDCAAYEAAMDRAVKKARGGS